MTPTLAITMGDINGVGPEIIAKVFAAPHARENYTPVVFGSVDAYNEARAHVPGAPEGVLVEEAIPMADIQEGSLPIFEGSVDVPPYRPGTLDPSAGACAMYWLECAVRQAMDGNVDGIVTCPINKQGIHAAGFRVCGHTDFIAEMTNAPSYRMCLFANAVRIVHNSAHVPLREAIRLTTKTRIEESIRLGAHALDRLDLPRRRIAVAGLNPHAGEAGAFGGEESAEILPAIERCRADGVDCVGPVSPDAVFRQAFDGDYDMVIAMYHDQGHIPLKLVAMDEGVNVTLGLPIVRTSVDHGTAYDIAGRNLARENSLLAAIRLAIELRASQPLEKQ